MNSTNSMNSMNSMNFFSDLAAAVSCYEMYFKPDTGVVEYIKAHGEEQMYRVEGELLAQDLGLKA
jgi:hypothetical protein